MFFHSLALILLLKTGNPGIVEGPLLRRAPPQVPAPPVQQQGEGGYANATTMGGGHHQGRFLPAVGAWPILTVAVPPLLSTYSCGPTSSGHTCTHGSTRVPGSPGSGRGGDWAADTGAGTLTYFINYTWPGDREALSPVPGVDPVLVVIRPTFQLCSNLATPLLTFTGSGAAKAGNVYTMPSSQGTVSPYLGLPPMSFNFLATAWNAHRTVAPTTLATVSAPGGAWWNAPASNATQLVFKLEGTGSALEQRNFCVDLTFRATSGANTAGALYYVEGGGAAGQLWALPNGRPPVCTTVTGITTLVLSSHCGPGFYMTGTTCRPCPCGFMQPNATAIQTGASPTGVGGPCVPCPPTMGAFCPGNTGAPVVCPAKFYCPDPASAAVCAPVACPAGTGGGVGLTGVGGCTSGSPTASFSTSSTPTVSPSLTRSLSTSPSGSSVGVGGRGGGSA